MSNSPRSRCGDEGRPYPGTGSPGLAWATNPTESLGPIWRLRHRDADQIAGLQHDEAAVELAASLLTMTAGRVLLADPCAGSKLTLTISPQLSSALASGTYG